MKCDLKSTRFIVLILSFIIVGTTFAADILYVTDVLQLQVYSDKGIGKNLATVRSGIRLKVLDSAPYYKKIQTDSGITGWVKSAYLVEAKPARLQLTELQDKNSILESEVRELRLTLTKPEFPVRQGEEVAGKVSPDTDKLNQLRHEEKGQSASLENAKKHFAFYKPQGVVDLRIWYLLIGLVIFITGIVLGVMLSGRSQQRHLSGLRVMT